MNNSEIRYFLSSSNRIFSISVQVCKGKRLIFTFIMNESHNKIQLYRLPAVPWQAVCTAECAYGMGDNNSLWQ